MGKLPYIPLYVNDLLGDAALLRCSPATRGVWLYLFLSMWNDGRTGKISGTPEELALFARCTPEQVRQAIEELKATGAADVERTGNVWTLVNRRMVRDNQKNKSAAERMKRLRSKKKKPDAGATETPWPGTPGETIKKAAAKKEQPRYPNQNAQTVSTKTNALLGTVSEFGKRFLKTYGMPVDQLSAAAMTAVSYKVIDKDLPLDKKIERMREIVLEFDPLFMLTYPDGDYQKYGWKVKDYIQELSRPPEERSKWAKPKQQQQPVPTRQRLD